MMQFSIDYIFSYISSEYRILKNDEFLKQTRYILSIDQFIIKISEILIKNKVLKNNTTYEVFSNCNKDKYKIFIKDKDIIFIGFETNYVPVINDTRVLSYLKRKIKYEFSIREIIGTVALQKLYLVTDCGVSFPLLNEKQLKIVNIEDENVIVQGVAGSGKTNICIDKIIYIASRNYFGKVLYSTYSRGLLIDTKTKVNAFSQNIKDFIQNYNDKKIIFLDKEHKRAIENKLGIFFDVDSKEGILEKLQTIVDYLDNKVDYFLIEDLYLKHVGKIDKIADEKYFTKTYLYNIKDHQLQNKINKLKTISHEIIYKEINGLILGSYNQKTDSDFVSLDNYISMRENSFSRQECETIYSIAKDYEKHLLNNKLLDNNLMSKALLKTNIEKYSLSILDEVQDMTEINLVLMKKISRKLLCVGDALQMINPAYFSFAYLKNLLYEKDIINVETLENNYRNTKKIADIIEDLNDINSNIFGVHNFVIKGKSIQDEIDTSCVYVNDLNYIQDVLKENYENITIVTSTIREKEFLRKLCKNTEILTISEIKGLERDIVILVNILSDNSSKWAELERIKVNRKQSNENSVYRYYLNLLYVGVSRAKTHLCIIEKNNISYFSNLFNNEFDKLNFNDAKKWLSNIGSKQSLQEGEIIDRIEKFISLSQYDNARFNVEKIQDNIKRNDYLNRIDINEKYVSRGDYKGAGIRYWELNMIDDAREMFKLSNDETLLKFMESTLTGLDNGLNRDIVQFLPEVYENEIAKELIVNVLKKDIKKYKENNKEINDRFKK